MIALMSALLLVSASVNVFLALQLRHANKINKQNFEDFMLVLVAAEKEFAHLQNEFLGLSQGIQPETNKKTIN